MRQEQRLKEAAQQAVAAAVEKRKAVTAARQEQVQMEPAQRLKQPAATRYPTLLLALHTPLHTYAGASTVAPISLKVLPPAGAAVR